MFLVIYAFTCLWHIQRYTLHALSSQPSQVTKNINKKSLRFGIKVKAGTEVRLGSVPSGTLAAKNNHDRIKPPHDYSIKPVTESARKPYNETHNRTKKVYGHRRQTKRKKSNLNTKQQLRSAQVVERRLVLAINNMRTLLSSTRKSNESSSSLSPAIKFPSVRECNSALAKLGDMGNLIHALRLFGQMRKSASLVSSYNALCIEKEKEQNDKGRLILCPPSPTLVTYSTLMSRAVALGKARVALRLWRLMTNDAEFYTNLSFTQSFNDSNENHHMSGVSIVPDLRAVNILMNAFAKLADRDHARLLLEQLYHGNVRGKTPSRKGFNTNLEAGDGMDIKYLIQVVPPMSANLVTYNTLIDACHRAGDLDAALEAMDHMKNNTQFRPDIRTYTSLISTVARRSTCRVGASNPDLAFSLLDEMVQIEGIRPNGMTYCALIDVCGRCRRSDLALKGLRMMLQQKSIEVKEKHITDRKQYQPDSSNQRQTQYSLYNEVGAWTAAINACGKAGRINTAIRLFHKMSKFGVKPNTVTCGCLTDCLLKSTNSKSSTYLDYVTETLNVLRFMKEERMQPSEVMYTSLINSAGKMAKMENEGNNFRTNIKDEFTSEVNPVEKEVANERLVESKVKITKLSREATGGSESSMKASEVYTELMLSLMPQASSPAVKRKGNSTLSNNLVKVFLVFQEMRSAGIEPDVACYNALLRACANTGDVARMNDVMRRMQLSGLAPDQTSKRLMLRGAAKASNRDT